MAEDKKNEPVEAVAVTQLGSTFAERAAFMKKVAAKQVNPEGDVEDKAVATKRTSTKKKG